MWEEEDRALEVEKRKLLALPDSCWLSDLTGKAGWGDSVLTSTRAFSDLLWPAVFSFLVTLSFSSTSLPLFSEEDQLELSTLPPYIDLIVAVPLASAAAVNVRSAAAAVAVAGAVLHTPVAAPISLISFCGDILPGKRDSQFYSPPHNLHPCTGGLARHFNPDCFFWLLLE